jgi:hypothetical protein
MYNQSNLAFTAESPQKASQHDGDSQVIKVDIREKEMK